MDTREGEAGAPDTSVRILVVMLQLGTPRRAYRENTTRNSRIFKQLHFQCVRFALNRPTPRGAGMSRVREPRNGSPKLSGEI